ncbi:MAG: hypothetical protein HC884_08065 [Chloroflexaceae bacterium]|nr:hypothetical protein [Chloroflexaceae bacterium]
MNQKLLQKQLARLASDRWARRGVRMLLRSAWLGLSVWSLALGGHLLFGWSLNYPLLQAIVLGCIALGAALLLLRPPMKPHDVAQRLDQRFGLKEEMTTAIELPIEGRPRGIEAYLLNRAHHDTFQIQRDIRSRQRFPWAELATLVALLLLAVGLVLTVNLEQVGSLEATPLPLPPLVAPGDLPPPPQSFPPQPPVGQQGNQEPVPGSGGEGETEGVSYDSGNAQQAMTTLADALRDLSITRPAAEALDRGDAAGAAQRLRELADQADQLSPETRGELADSLRDASREMSMTHPELAGQLRNSAAGLHDPQQADRALDDLATAIEQLGPQQQQTAQVPPSAQNSGSEQAPETDENEAIPQDWREPEQRTGPGGGASNAPSPPGERRERSEPSERLNVEGVPLELESDTPDHAPVEDDGDEGEEAPSDSGPGTRQFVQSGEALDDTEVQAGADPLRIPMDLRDVVQEYFSPPQ